MVEWLVIAAQVVSGVGLGALVWRMPLALARPRGGGGSGGEAGYTSAAVVMVVLLLTLGAVVGISIVFDTLNVLFGFVLALLWRFATRPSDG